MAIGERIRFFRNLHGMTMRTLGNIVGYSPNTADVRIAQYESGSRTPKAELISKLAQIFDISTDALNVPDIDSYTGLMHTLFALEDIYGLQVEIINDEPCLHFKDAASSRKFSQDFRDWHRVLTQYRNGEINRTTYDHWRYNFPADRAAETRERLDALRNQLQNDK